MNQTSGEVCRGDTVDCDDIQDWQCYSAEVYGKCCSTCNNELQTGRDSRGCEFGDRRPDCDVDKGRRCYEGRVRDECCQTCRDYETNIKGCRYGDKLIDCRLNECQNYTIDGQRNCCFTCKHIVLTTSGASVSSDSTSSSSSGVGTMTSSSSKLPHWVLPVVASGGVALLFLTIILVCVIYRRKNRQTEDGMSPFDEKTYNEYKLSRRPPMALPRGPGSLKEDTKDRKVSEVYAYINPDDVCDDPKDRPQPPVPNEYLDLEASNDYSYAENTENTIEVPGDGEVTRDVIVLRNANSSDDVRINSPVKAHNHYQKYPPS